LNVACIRDASEYLKNFHGDFRGAIFNLVIVARSRKDEEEGKRGRYEKSGKLAEMGIR